MVTQMPAYEVLSHPRHPLLAADNIYEDIARGEDIAVNIYTKTLLTIYTKTLLSIYTKTLLTIYTKTLQGEKTREIRGS